jgi:hypothetical protein
MTEEESRTFSELRALMGQIAKPAERRRGLKLINFLYQRVDKLHEGR